MTFENYGPFTTSAILPLFEFICMSLLFAAVGDGFSTRIEDSMLHGCIPVIIMDKVHGVFESLFEYDRFSVRVAESSLRELPDILHSISDVQVQHMQRRIAHVWTRYV